jgi:hypothetical protein
MIKKPARTRAEAGLSFEDFTQEGRLIYIMGQRPQHSWEVTYGSTLHPRGLQSSKSRKLIRDGIMPAYAFLPGRNITKQNPEKRKMAYICNLAYFPEPVHTLPIGTRLQPNQTPLDRFILLKV